MASTTRVLVGVRVRPLNERELVEGNGLASSFRADTTNASIEAGDVAMSYDKVFDQSADSDAVFNIMVSPLIDEACRGFNATVFAYGQTSSGKTHTMSAMTELATAKIFGMISDSRSVTVKMSMFEIYNEQIRDLLDDDDKKKLKLREHESNVYVSGLSEHIVSSSEALNKLLTEGSTRRKVASTHMNHRSSRSHLIMRLDLSLKTIENGVTVNYHSVLQLVDLAGSERASATSGMSERLKEGAQINSSLHHLGLVIRALAAANSKEFIPFRNSVLTRILQPALGGNSRTALIACVTPASEHLDETVSTLRFAADAKQITNKISANRSEELTKDERIRKLEAVVRRQSKQLIRARVSMSMGSFSNANRLSVESLESIEEEEEIGDSDSDKENPNQAELVELEELKQLMARICCQLHESGGLPSLSLFQSFEPSQFCSTPSRELLGELSNVIGHYRQSLSHSEATRSHQIASLNAQLCAVENQHQSELASVAQQWQLKYDAAHCVWRRELDTINNEWEKTLSDSDESAKQQLQQMAQAIDTGKHYIDSLTEQLTELKDNEAKLQCVLSEQQQTIRSLEQELESHQSVSRAKGEQWTGDLAAKNETIQSLEQSLASLESRATEGEQRLKSEVSELQGTIQSLTVQLADREAERTSETASHQQSLRAAREEVASLQRIIESRDAAHRDGQASLTDELTRANESLQSLRHEIAAQHTKFDQLSSSHSETVQSLERRMAAMTLEHEVWVKQLVDSHQYTVNSLTQTIETCEAKHRDFEESLRRSLHQQQEANDQSSQQHENLRQRYEELELALNDSQHRTTALTISLSESQSLCAQQATQFAALSVELERTKKRIPTQATIIELVKAARTMEKEKEKSLYYCVSCGHGAVIREKSSKTSNGNKENHPVNVSK